MSNETVELELHLFFFDLETTCPVYFLKKGFN